MSQPPGWQAPGSAPGSALGSAPGSAPGSVPAGGAWGEPRYAPPPPPPPSPGGPAPFPGAPYGQAPPPGWVEPPRPGVVPLRPLGLGELLDGSVRTMRHNPRVMFGLSALVMGGTVLLSTVLLLVGLPQALGSLDASGEVDSAEVASLVSAGLVGFVVPAVVQALALSVLNGVLVLAVSEAVIGRRPGIGEVVRRVGWRGVGRLLLLTVVTSIIALVGVAVVAVPVVLAYLAAVALGVVATVLAIPVLAAGGLLLLVRFSFAAPALLLEDLGVVAALRRSWRLSRSSTWRVLGVLLLSSVIGWVTSGVLQVPFSLVGTLVEGAIGVSADGDNGTTLAMVVGFLVQNVGVVLSTTVVSPFTAGVVSLLYIDLRIRREGLDVALARAAAEPAGVRDGPRPAGSGT